MVVLFAVLLTRQNHSAEPAVEPASATRASAAIFVGACLAAVLAAAIMASEFRPAPATAPTLSVRQIGLELMHRHGATLLIVGVILTVALLGATVIAATENSPEDAP
jgi:NADH:ubiquinone oxidoreductase subunit 6 (subunit J)